MGIDTPAKEGKVRKPGTFKKFDFVCLKDDAPALPVRYEEKTENAEAN